MKKSILLCGINIEHLKTLKYHIFFYKKLASLLFAATVAVSIKKEFEEEESIEILKIIGLITWRSTRWMYN